MLIKIALTTSDVGRLRPECHSAWWYEAVEGKVVRCTAVYRADHRKESRLQVSRVCVWEYLVLVEVHITKFALLQAVHQIHLLVRQADIRAGHVVTNRAPGKKTEKSRVQNINCKVCSFHTKKKTRTIGTCFASQVF